MMSLSLWMKKYHRDYPDLTEKEKKEEIAELLGCALSTLYRWIKDENIFIEEFGSGEDSAVNVWKLEKTVTG